MARATHDFNDNQQRVLRWIDPGCPDGEYDDDNYGHPITAKALEAGSAFRESVSLLPK
ncbi:hypothetical protein P9139_17955 [Curtobacterium flaccumfaciens]|nr:hypothetical protein P9139_17955 [Curtobacterium flaccumfaciens]